MRERILRKKSRNGSILGAIFCVLVLVASISTAIDVSKESEELSMNADSLSYTFLFQDPNLLETYENNQDFTLLELNGCLPIGKNPGQPMMPAKPISLLLPPMKEVTNVQIVGTPVIVDLTGFNLADKPVFPYQNPVPFGTAPGDFIIDDAVYSADATYPGVLKDDFQIGYSRGYAIFNTVLNPVQYNPVDAELVYYPEMSIIIELEDTSSVNPLFRNNANDEAWVEKLVYNPDITEMYTSDIPTFGYDGGLCDPDDSYDYVIVTTEYNGLDYWDTSNSTPYNWESLMDKHESDDGLSCTLVTVEDIYACNDYDNSNPIFNDDEAHIREFAKDAYQDWETEYILIGGDDENNWIPAREMDTNYEVNIDSDIYWSNLDNNFNDDEDNYWGEEGDDGFDLYCEIYIGRVTCDEPQDVSNWLTKSFYYADSIEDTYLDNTGFYGGNTGWNCQGDDFMDYSAIKGTDDWLGPIPGADGPFPTWAGFQFGFETWNQENPDNQYEMAHMWTAEPPNPGWQGGTESAAITGFKNAISNDEITLASGIAHANANMALDVGYNSWESDYHNTKPFFLHDYGCHCGDMDAADDGVLHSMLFHSDTELAFAVVFNTGYGWGNFDTTNSSSAFQTKEFWSYFLDMDNKSVDFSNWQLGKGHAFSKDRMAPTINWDYSSGTWRAVIQGCLLFGDPAQQLKTPHPSEKPAQPDPPEGPAEWIQEVECTFTASTTDPEGEGIYYLFDWGDGNFSEWLGPYPSGQTVETENSWPDLGNYEIRVKARDIWGVMSDWSDPAPLAIVTNKNPVKVEIDGEGYGFGGTEYEFTFLSSDEDGHDIYYRVNWDDGTDTGYIGPYSSGEQITLSHSWDVKGNYWIKAWAKDTLEGSSQQASHQLIILTNKAHSHQRNPLFIQILERLLGNFPIFEWLL